MKKNFKLLLGVFVVLAVVLFLTVGARLFSGNLTTTQNPKNDVVEVIDPETGERIIFHADGYIERIGDAGSTFTAWESGKAASFFEYIYANFQSGFLDGYSITLNGQSGGLPLEDELIGEVIDEVTNEDGGGEDGGAGQFFASPTPASGGGASATNPPGSGGSGGGGGAGPSWCKHWKLSYCADPPAPPPTATPTSTYPPGVIQAENCDEWNEQSQYRTIISNSECLQ